MTTIIDSLATIKHLNIRKEGPEDSKVLAIDIKFGDASANMALLSRILGSDCEATAKASFWDDEGAVRFSGLDPITSWCVIEGCAVKIGGLQLVGKVHKFKTRMQSEWKMELEFSVTVTDPPSNATPILAEYVQDDIRVIVDKEQGELELAAEQAA